MLTTLLLALGANLAFSTSTLFYAHYSKKYSSLWMNFFKALVATAGFALIVLFIGFQPLHFDSIWMLSLSGFMGLFIGDLFLLKAMTYIGAGRTLMLFGFSPLILGLSAQYLFQQEFGTQRLIAILCLIGCLWSFAFESFKEKGHWEVKGLLFALIGVLLDNAGVLLTRQSFELSPEISPFQANFIRAFAATAGFLAFSFLPRLQFSPIKIWKRMSLRDRYWMTAISFLGTCVSLGFYLTAIKSGHLATVSAVTVTSPLFATLIEVLIGHKKANRYLWLGLFFFLSGFTILLF